MAIRRNGNKPKIVEEKKIESNKESSFTPDEATFLTSKLREANYKGTEFETFYKIMSKLAKIAEK
jgi:hypothetical protein